MMNKPRASIFEETEELDVSGFTTKSTPDVTAPAPEEVRAVAEAANFRSREAKVAKPVKQAAPPKRSPRRYRTGRNVQLNLKASQKTVDSFYQLTDANDWVLGETLERAIGALQRELEREKLPSSAPAGTIPKK
jgi:hypothetical protein